jgi:LysR family nitrogen assimilation transcriptional regulator
VDLKQLQYFQCIAELGGFSKAAAVLSVTQPALSRQIRQLEIELHQNLLVRNGRGVALTDEGTLLLERAKDILDHVERTRLEIRDLKGSPTGKVILGCSHAIGTNTVASLVTRFRKRFPKASLEIIEVKGWTAYEWLLSGRLDIAILYDPPASPFIEFTRLRVTPLYLVSPVSSTTVKKSAKVPVRQLSKYPLILPGSPRAINNVVGKAAAEAGVKLHTVLHIEGSVFIMELVYRGHGYTILPEHTVQESKLSDKLQMNAVTSPRLDWTLTMAISTQRRLTHLTRDTADMIKALFVHAPKSTEK